MRDRLIKFSTIFCALLFSALAAFGQDAPGSATRVYSAAELQQHLDSLPTPPVHDQTPFSFSQFDLLEYRAYSAGPDTFTWDYFGWFGGDYNRLWVKTEGDLDLSRGNGAQGDLQLLYGRMIAPYFDFQVGARLNGILSPDRSAAGRSYGVIGLQGLAPYNFDIEPSIYISDRGEVSAEFTASVDLYLTQRLVMQPRFEVEASIQGDRKFDTGEGVNQTDLGLRFRYEFRREIAPYIGVTWQRRYGNTASIARSESEPDDAIALAVGFQLWW